MAYFFELLNNYFAYALIPLLLGCALWFTLRTGGIQFRMLGEMFRQLKGSGKKTAIEPAKSATAQKTNKKSAEKHISSFQAFMVSLAGRVGTGNLAGVATAIIMGGAGAVFWMWVTAALGAATSFFECTLAQLYKTRSKDSFVGGPAYYIKRGLKSGWLAVVVAIISVITFGWSINTVQSNTIADAFNGAFGIPPVWTGIVLCIAALMIFFGGIQRIAKISEIVVPVMAVSYIILALVIVAMNANQVPAMLQIIIDDAFSMRAGFGGLLGTAVMFGVRRGLFSNEAGMGSSPNVAATASVKHPVQQGLVQSLGVFTDTLLICSCTAFIILLSGLHVGGESQGVQLTQQAMDAALGTHGFGEIFIAIAIFLFAFSTIFSNYYYGEANMRFLTHNRTAMTLYRLSAGAMVLLGAAVSLEAVWNFADVTIAMIAIVNLIAVTLLSPKVIALIKDFRSQKRAGVKTPEFKDSNYECWK